MKISVSGIAAVLLLSLATSGFAQTFNYLSDSRSISASLYGHPASSLTPVTPFANFYGTIADTNSATDYYQGIMNSTVSPTGVSCYTYLALCSTLPPGAGSGGSGATSFSISFDVSSPVAVSFSAQNFVASGFTWDGPLPSYGLKSTDPSFPTDPANWGLVTLQPGYTYTVFESMQGLVYPDIFGRTAVPVNGTMQLDMSLAAVPEPAVPLLGGLAAGIVALRRRSLK